MFFLHFVGGIEEVMVNIRQGRQYPGRDSNQGPSQDDSTASPSHQLVCGLLYSSVMGYQSGDEVTGWATV